MGAYLSEPVIEKLSSDENGEWLSYGASSMQGWRVSQEDAHNSILNFDKDTHIFAVYDGHGGHEVSAYTALKLPDYLRNNKAYKDDRLPYALTDTFLGLDSTLTGTDVITELKIIAGTKDEDEQGDDSDSDEDVQDLYREATMPLDQVMARYPHLAQQNKEKMASPFLKAKNTGGSSTGESGSPIKFDFTEEEGEDKEKAAAQESLRGSSKSKEVNGDGSKHMVNGEEENGEVKTKEETTDKIKEETTDKKEETTDKTKEKTTDKTKEETTDKTKEEKSKEEKNGDEKEEGHKEESDKTKTEALKENGDTAINGEEEQTEVVSKGKGKGSGKGGKGKALLKNSEIQAMKEAKAKGRRREAAIRAAEIYRKIQEFGGEGPMEEDDSDDDEDESDNTFEEEEDEDKGDEDEGEEDGEGEESEDDDDDDDDDDDEDDEAEVEEDDDPYTEFAMNMKEEPGYDSGCTACVAVVRKGRVYVANVGDSRCVVYRGGKALDLSIDHKPEDDPEAARIIRAGGRVTADGRVNGGLNLSRAIGDHGYKQNKSLDPEDQMISPLPDVRSLALTPEDNFMIVACDGIWNSLTSQEACDFVADRLEDDKKLSEICEELFDHCLAPDTHGDGTGCDNMTCIIVKFNPKALEARGADKDEGVVEELVKKDSEEEKMMEKVKKEIKEDKKEKVKKEIKEDKKEKGDKSTEQQESGSASGGTKRRSEEAEIDSPKSDEKKLKPSSE